MRRVFRGSWVERVVGAGGVRGQRVESKGAEGEKGGEERGDAVGA